MEHPKPEDEKKPPFWCDVCSIDLQSSASKSEHVTGRKHVKRLERNANMNNCSAMLRVKRPSSSALPPIDEAELFESLATGKYRNIVILTGAGVSTAAGIPDFRSPGGLYESIRSAFGSRFPDVAVQPEVLLSRGFVNRHPKVWNDEVMPFFQEQRTFGGAHPTATHRFCAWLNLKGWLRRVYTQNVDGLHLHPDLGEMPAESVMECHGSMADGSVVMYGDPLPPRFAECCDEDFPREGSNIDLVLTFGSSLQVAPFCAVPNLAPKGCVRVLVNRDLDDCLRNSFSGERGGVYCTASRPASTVRIGERKEVALRPLWTDRKGAKRWRQLLVEGDCDDFVHRFFASEAAKWQGHKLSNVSESKSVVDGLKTLKIEETGGGGQCSSPSGQ